MLLETVHLGLPESSRDPPTSASLLLGLQMHSTGQAFLFFTRVLGIELRSPKLHPTLLLLFLVLQGIPFLMNREEKHTYMRGVVCLFIYSELAITWLYNCGAESCYFPQISASTPLGRR